MKRRLFIFGALLLLCTAAKAQNETPLLRIGIVADCQYYDGPVSGSRHYALSPGKLEEAVDFFNARKVDFTISLGDLIDRDIRNFDPVLAILEKSDSRVYHLCGNHEFSVGDDQKAAAVRKLGLDPRKRYYDFTAEGFRFVVIDGSDVSLFGTVPGTPQRAEAERIFDSLRKAGVPSAKRWNGAAGAKQLEWLDRTLAKASRRGERVILLSHFPLQTGKPSETLWNSGQVLALIDRHPCVAAHLSGHAHQGGREIRNGVLHFTFKGMVEGESNRFALLELYPDRLVIAGQGEQPGETFPFPSHAE